MIRGLKMQFRCTSGQISPSEERRQVIPIGFGEVYIDAELKNAPRGRPPALSVGNVDSDG